MTIARCKLCKGIIITTEHLRDKKNSLCIDCIMKSFKPSKVDGYIICKFCGVAVGTLQKANEHLQSCQSMEQLIAKSKTQGGQK